MSRPTVHKLIVSMDELDWIRKTITRKSQHATSTPGVQKALRSALEAFSDKLAIAPDALPKGGYLLKTNRRDIRILQEVVKAEHAALVTKIIPEYMNRVEASPTEEERKRYRTYQDTTTKRSEMLLGLINQIERVMDR